MRNFFGLGQQIRSEAIICMKGFVLFHLGRLDEAAQVVLHYSRLSEHPLFPYPGNAARIIEYFVRPCRNEAVRGSAQTPGSDATARWRNLPGWCITRLQEILVSINDVGLQKYVTSFAILKSRATR